MKPWYKVVTPREDLREGRPLDASEFAVHLDHVREGRAPVDYQDPARFFERTYVTKTLSDLAVNTARRLNGIKVETSAVFNLSTQFGGGKTHALTLLYHMARGGPRASAWKGVSSVLDRAQVKSVPEAAVAVFVGTEFDALTGRGGKDGTPKRHTPWGEIAFQLGGADAFSVVAQHDKERTAPATEVIRHFLPKDRPVLILMDELVNFMSRNRKSGLTTQLYSFMQNLSEEARAQERLVLAASLPSLADEMTPEDEADFERFQKLLDRLGKAMVMSAETETAEIIRRRLFEWGGLPDEARKTAGEYADWILEHREQIPKWFSADTARDAFAATYPFHPALLSVFERKWRALPRFQQTRGILRLLALWVSNAYQAGYKGAHKDPLIGMGTAPLDDTLFRVAAFEQLGSGQLEAAVTTDICGKKDAHAVALDGAAVDSIRKARLHQKIATAIFFESNGGQAKAEATMPEIRLAVAEPDLDVGNVETALEALTETCYYLTADRNRYRFSLTPNLNKLLADRRASVQAPRVAERVKKDIQKVFAAGTGPDRIYFPEKSGQIPDRPAVTVVVLAPDQEVGDRLTRDFIETASREHGSTGRAFKSALLWAVPENAEALREEARKVLAWEDIEDESGDLKLDETQRRQLEENVKKAQRDLREAVWRTYKNVLLLGKDGTWQTVDLGLVHSSAAETIVTLIVNRLKERGDIEDGLSPQFLVRNWPPAFVEWSTRGVRDACYASPQFPRLLDPEAIKRTISKGVESGAIAYVGKKPDGGYEPFIWREGAQKAIRPEEVEISDEVFIIRREAAEAVAAGGTPPTASGASRPQPPVVQPLTPGGTPGQLPFAPGEPAAQRFARVVWEGDVPPQKWMNFYTKVLARFATKGGLSVALQVFVEPPGGVSQPQIDEMRAALRELGLEDHVEIASADQSES